MTTQLTNNRLFGDIFDPFFEDVISPVISNVKANRFSYSEEDESYFVEIESPRFKKEDLSITVNDGLLTVKGDLNRDRVRRLIEKHYLIPRDAACDKLAATLKYGVLTISMPKSEEAKSLKVEIKEED